MLSYEENMAVARKIAQKVSLEGGRAYFVGGYVRDKILGIDNKDIDIEVHGVSGALLEHILDSVGKRLAFGKSFGVYSIEGSSIDIALPRKEECTGKKHTDFKIDTDPFLGTEKSSRRRDFTINAIMQDVLTGKIIDYYGGEKDIKDKIIRHIDDKTFSEDPLRVLRAAQFAARFEFEVDEETIRLCQKMDVSTVSAQRVFEELKKALLKAKKPSLFFRTLLKMNKLSPWFIEVGNLLGVMQNKKYHPEGDVFEHTMIVLDKAAKLRSEAANPLGFMLAALVHDFGKTVTTEIIKGEIHSYGHEKEGLPLINEFIKRISSEKKLVKYVMELSRHHMKPNVLALCKAGIKSTNKMFDSVSEPCDLIYLAMADKGENDNVDNGETEKFLNDRLMIYREYMSRDYVTGEDLIKAGLKPGEDFRELLNYAHKLRLAGVKKESALKQILSYKSDKKE